MGLLDVDLTIVCPEHRIERVICNVVAAREQQLEAGQVGASQGWYDIRQRSAPTRRRARTLLRNQDGDLLGGSRFSKSPSIQMILMTVSSSSCPPLASCSRRPVSRFPSSLSGLFGTEEPRRNRAIMKTYSKRKGSQTKMSTRGQVTFRPEDPIDYFNQAIS